MPLTLINNNSSLIVDMPGHEILIAELRTNDIDAHMRDKTVMEQRLLHVLFIIKYWLLFFLKYILIFHVMFWKEVTYL
jgi:hypothetical protein